VRVHSTDDSHIQLKEIKVGDPELPTEEDLNFSIATVVGESSPVGPILEKLGIAMVIKRRAESKWGGNTTFKEVILGTGLYGNPSASSLARLAELYLNKEQNDLEEFKKLVDQAHNERSIRSADRKYLKSKAGFHTFVQRIEQAKTAMEFVLEEAAFAPDLTILAKEATWWGGEIDLWDSKKCKIWKHGEQVMNSRLVFVAYREFGKTYFLKEALSVSDKKQRDEEIERSKKYLCEEMEKKSGCERETILENNPECQPYLETSKKPKPPQSKSSPGKKVSPFRGAADAHSSARRLSSNVSRADPEISFAFEERISTLHGGGRPLPDSVRAFLEPRFGYDFSRVLIHTDERAAESARTINAHAYTVGRDIVFGAGQYAPDSSTGKRLLAHELTHVAQQNPMRPMEGIQPMVASDATQMSITEDWAKALTFEELENQINRIREQLWVINPNTPEYDTALRNLQILEAEALREDAKKAKALRRNFPRPIKSTQIGY
jgi:hypothetical protein